jgi:hypothetical protein
MKKVFVDVLVKYTKDGRLIPLTVMWEDGRRFEIDKVLEEKKAASLKVGGQGLRYKCRIYSKEIFLWLEDGKWFVEAKQ